MKTTSLIGISFLVFVYLLGRSEAAPGSIDLSFDPGSGVDQPVSVTVVQPDGKVIIGARLTR